MIIMLKNLYLILNLLMARFVGSEKMQDELAFVKEGKDIFQLIDDLKHKLKEEEQNGIRQGE